MNDFIILHSAEDNSPVMINISQIEHIETYNKKSSVYFLINEESIDVNESVEKIYNIINEKKKTAVQEPNSDSLMAEIINYLKKTGEFDNMKMLKS